MQCLTVRTIFLGALDRGAIRSIASECTRATGRTSASGGVRAFAAMHAGFILPLDCAMWAWPKGMWGHGVAVFCVD
ncbi:MAG TPA: hypothetical protein VL048_01690 [Xanthobacteraceae bacterium]|nr:hypothetical protein [Xanthobacteraceae bacterium]